LHEGQQAAQRLLLQLELGRFARRPGEARKVLGGQRLQGEAALAGLDQQSLVLLLQRNLRPSGSARRISRSFLAPTVTARASAGAPMALRAAIWISMSVARNASMSCARSISTFDKIGSV